MRNSVVEMNNIEYSIVSICVDMRATEICNRCDGIVANDLLVLVFEMKQKALTDTRTHTHWWLLCFLIEVRRQTHTIGFMHDMYTSPGKTTFFICILCVSTN